MKSKKRNKLEKIFQQKVENGKQKTQIISSSLSLWQSLKYLLLCFFFDLFAKYTKSSP